MRNELVVAPKLVLLFPVRKFDTQGRNLWTKIVKLLEESPNVRLHVIDKTPEELASKFFQTYVDSRKLTCTKGKLEKGLFSSLTDTFAEEGEWVGQIHDDDDFVGTLQYSTALSSSTILRPSAFVRETSHESVSFTFEDSNTPAFILFSFLPANLWNCFVSYLNLQGGHCSPSLDVTLNFAARLNFAYDVLEDYTYKYRATNWSSRYRHGISVRKYMKADGWGAISNLITAEFLTKLEKITFAIWIEKNCTNLFKSNLATTAFKEFEAGRLHKLRIISSVIMYFFIGYFSNLKTFGGQKSYSPFLEKFDLRYEVLKRIFLSYRAKELHELLKCIEFLEIAFNATSLHPRIRFWAETIKSYDNLSKS